MEKITIGIIDIAKLTAEEITEALVNNDVKDKEVVSCILDFVTKTIQLPVNQLRYVFTKNFKTIPIEVHYSCLFKDETRSIVKVSLKEDVGIIAAIQPKI